MFAFLGGIVALIALGTIVVLVIALTIKWLKTRLREKLALQNAQKTVVADIKELVKNCDNKISLDDLDELADKEGYTHFMATIDDNNEVIGEVEMVKDTNGKQDVEVQRLLGRNGMVVVEK